MRIYIGRPTLNVVKRITSNEQQSFSNDITGTVGVH